MNNEASVNSNQICSYFSEFLLRAPFTISNTLVCLGHLESPTYVFSPLYKENAQASIGETVGKDVRCSSNKTVMSQSTKEEENHTRKNLIFIVYLSARGFYDMG